MERNQRKGRDLKRDEAWLDAEVLAAVRRFVRKQKRKGVKVQYLNFLWDGEHYPRMSTEYGLRVDVVQSSAQALPENDTTSPVSSGIFPTRIGDTLNSFPDTFILKT